MVVRSLEEAVDLGIVPAPDQFLKILISETLVSNRRWGSQVPEVSPIERQANRVTFPPEQTPQQPVAERDCLVPGGDRGIEDQVEVRPRQAQLILGSSALTVIVSASMARPR